MSDAARMVGFVGLGQIGAPMASHLVGWPGGLVVCDVRTDATDPLAGKGAAVAATPAEVAAAAQVISVMVRDDSQVEEVVSGADGLLAAASPGAVVAIHSTIRSDTAERLAARAAKQGVDVVDAPVSGGFMGAHEGNLAVMVGGTAEAVERCREPFARWSELLVHTGAVGSGTRAKLARNLITFAGYCAALESQRLAEAAAIDLAELAKVVRHSDSITGGPGAIMIRTDTGPVGADDSLHDILAHTRDLGEKDLDLALELGGDLGVDLPFTALARERLASALGVPR